MATPSDTGKPFQTTESTKGLTLRTEAGKVSAAEAYELSLTSANPKSVKVCQTSAVVLFPTLPFLQFFFPLLAQGKLSMRSFSSPNFRVTPILWGTAAYPFFCADR